MFISSFPFRLHSAAMSVALPLTPLTEDMRSPTRTRSSGLAAFHPAKGPDSTSTMRSIGRSSWATSSPSRTSSRCFKETVNLLGSRTTSRMRTPFFSQAPRSVSALPLTPFTATMRSPFPTRLLGCASFQLPMRPPLTPTISKVGVPSSAMSMPSFSLFFLSTVTLKSGTHRYFMGMARSSLTCSSSLIQNCLNMVAELPETPLTSSTRSPICISWSGLSMFHRAKTPPGSMPAMSSSSFLPVSKWTPRSSPLPPSSMTW
mmetsp:Transcript_62682/g.136126  ORF Transcript_62682/g.136126 Transcript_62682/m.136126 type:complete len:260 (-) Transcript_62682:323-1102(-)